MILLLLMTTSCVVVIIQRGQRPELACEVYYHKSTDNKPERLRYLSHSRRVVLAVANSISSAHHMMI